MSKFDNYLKTIGILAHFFFLAYMWTEYQNYIYGLLSFVLGSGGFIYLNFNHSFVSLKNPIASIYLTSVILLCTFLIVAPICLLLGIIFDIQKPNVFIGIKILMFILLSISILFNYRFHKDRQH